MRCAVNYPQIAKGLPRIVKRVIIKTIGPISQVSTKEPLAALTFDDGPHPIFTPLLLDILKKHRARATFFMIGQNASRYPEIVQQVAQAGHTIGNHSWNHPSFPSVAGQERRAQIRTCARALAPYGQRLFRPPYGEYNLASQLDALWLGYKVIHWSLDIKDWRGLDADRMAEQIVTDTRSGSIVLLHDHVTDPWEERFSDREPMLRAVNMFLEETGNRLRFVTIPELLRNGLPQRL